MNETHLKIRMNIKSTLYLGATVIIYYCSYVIANLNKDYFNNIFLEFTNINIFFCGVLCMIIGLSELLVDEEDFQ